MDNVPNLNSPVSSPSRTYVRVLVSALLLVAIMGVASFYYYARVRDVDSKLATSGKPLTIMSYYWPGYYWIDIAERKGWFDEAGLNVSLVDTNSDYYKGVADFAEGKIDIYILPLFDVLTMLSEGKDVVMFIATDSAFGSEGIVAKESIKNVSSLRGKTVGLPMGTYLEYVLDLALRRSRVDSRDVVKLPINAEHAQEEFATGKYDAVLTWDPYFSDTVKEGNGKKIFDSSEIQNLSPEGAVVLRSFLNERPEDLQALTEVWHKTTTFIKENPIESYGIIAEIYGKPLVEVEALVTTNKIFDLRDNITAFSYSAGFESLHGVARNMNKFLIETNVTDRQFDSLQFLSSQFIRSLDRTLKSAN